MERIVFLDRDSIRAELRRPAFPHEWIDFAATAPEEVVARLQGATVVVSNKVAVMGPSLAQLPALRFIAVCATGTNNVDLDYCRAHNIAVSNIRGYAVHAVPEHVFALALALRRNMLAYRDDVRRGDWQRSAQFCLFHHPIADLHGSTLGIVGHGTLGQSVARLGSAFGMRVLLAEHKGAAAVRPGRTAFDAVLKESDVITLHCPLTEQSRNLIGIEELRQMRPHTILINTARGGLVDETALAEALRQGTIGGAGFDVLTTEPPRGGNPLLDLDQPNFILTPHCAWASTNAMQIMADQLIDNIESYVRGEPHNRVA